MSENKRFHEESEALVAQSLEVLVAPRVRHDREELIGNMLRQLDAAVPEGSRRPCLHAAFWLLADDLGRAHTLCQEVPTAYGAAWHAVVHRREGDFWNSKYWWRQARAIPWSALMQRLRDALPAHDAVLSQFLGHAAYDPAAFVDLVAAHHESGKPQLIHALVAIQRLEWLALFDATWTSA